jgi:hypothetical protein
MTEGASGDHDHSLHLDTKFIHGEALRMSYQKRSNMFRDVGVYIEGLEQLNAIYDNLAAISPDDREGVISLQE